MSEPVTIYRSDYQPYPFIVRKVNLNIDLYEEYALITNHMQLQGLTSDELYLYGDELELIRLELNGQALTTKDYEFRGQDLFIKHCPNAFELTIITRIYPQKNTTLSGLYRSNGLFCTQCEAQGFRRITYFPDRPDVLTQYTTRICADKTNYPILLSNGNLMDKGHDLDTNRHWVVWDDPFKKPSYLFALVAGHLSVCSDEFITMSGRKVALRLYVEPGNDDKCSHALHSLKQAMRWDEQEYGREYDLDVYMIVAVSDFNMGAMENKGLNIFNSKYILACPETATDDDYANIEGVVAHEYFHNWTGNRVTCRDWFQLSLKEGLTVFRDQEFSRDMNSRDVNRILDVKVLRNAQFPEDAGTMAHPVRPESYQEINNFYTATVYNKGAEIIRMQQTLLGKDGFRRGMDLYFKRHDGEAVTIDDFVAAMEDANDVDFSQFKRWYSQAGTPEVTVARDYKAGVLTLTFSQTCRPTDECLNKEPFLIPIRMALFNKQGQQIALEHEVLQLSERRQSFQFERLQEMPWISLLREFSAPVILYQVVSDEERLALLRYETDGFAQWNAAEELALAQVVTAYNKPRQQWQLPQTLLDAFEHSLGNDALDEALRAELIAPPGFDDVVAELSMVDVTLVEHVRDWYRAELGLGLWSRLVECYKTRWRAEDHSMNQAAYNRRKLRNRCLWFMMKSQEEQALTLCQQQFHEARTMTDQIASFSLLVNCHDEMLAQQAIDAFYTQWRHDDLVMDKWFALQATCERPDTLIKVKTLLTHSAFDMKKPNKVRALIGAFCQSNPRHFHALDGSGYVFLRDVLLEIDPINPQIAARLATPFTRWQRYDAPRQEHMQAQLAILDNKALSRDLREVISKSLKR